MELLSRAKDRELNDDDNHRNETSAKKKVNGEIMQMNILLSFIIAIATQSLNFSKLSFLIALIHITCVR